MRFPFIAAALLVSSSLSSGPTITPRRYWRLYITAAMTDVSGVVAVNNIVLAESAGGPHVLGAVNPTANSGTGSNATDASFSTNWTSGSGAFPRTLTWDLGATSGNWKDIYESRISVDPAWHPQAPKTYKIQYSDDNVNWFDRITVAADTTWNGATTDGWCGHIAQASGCPDTIGGYLFYRLNISSGNDATQVSAAEIAWRDTVGGTNRARSSPAFFSQQAGANPASNAFDGNNGTGYFGTAGFPYTIGCELAQRYPLAQCSIVPFSGLAGYAPKNFLIQGSKDRVTWDTLATIINQTAWAANPTARDFNI